jgi:hypothetical protein
VERRDRPPVGVPEQTVRRVESALHKPRPVDVNGFELPLEPREAGRRISARSRSSRPGSTSSTRQKSSASPT